MAEFAYSLDGGLVIKDYELDAGYASPKRGDFVVITNGKIAKVVALTGTTISGVLEGQEFTGLVAQGQPYAATNSFPFADAQKKAIAKVRIGKGAVYRIPKGDATVGIAVGVDANGAAAATATAKPLTVVDVQGDFAFVRIA